VAEPGNRLGRLTRKQLLQTAAATVPAFMLAGRAGAGIRRPVHGYRARERGGRGMNVVVFLTDQERAIQHFPKGWAQANLPGLTRLQRNGLTFTNAFTNTCMCSPARSTFLSGYFPAQHGVKYTLEESMPADEYPQVELPVDLPNLASVMPAAGYNAVYKGKWHVDKPAGSTWAPEDVGKYGFGRWSPPDAGANQDVDQEGGGTYNHDGAYMNSVGNAADGTEGALQYLRSYAAQQQPFFLVISLVNPHDVLLYPRHYVDGGYDDSWLEGTIGLPPTVRESLKTKPIVQQEFLKIFNLSGPLPTPQMKRNYLNFYGNLMQTVDGYLVDVLDTLTQQGLLENTLVIRTSDHGEMGLAHGGLREKNFNVYEESLRVPLVYSNPTLYPRPRRSDALVSHVDFLPTLASLFGAPASARAHWQGVDYSDIVLGRSSKPPQRYVVFTYDDYQSGQASPPYPTPPNHIVSIRERRWKLAKYYDAAGKVPPQWEMYDLQTDPLERRNIAYKGHRRTAREEREYRRLRRELAAVQKTRLRRL
jgi:choline-sulfatase